MEFLGESELGNDMPDDNSDACVLPSTCIPPIGKDLAANWVGGESPTRVVYLSSVSGACFGSASEMGSFIVVSAVFIANQSFLKT